MERKSCQELLKERFRQGFHVCVGLDLDPAAMPECVKKFDICQTASRNLIFVCQTMIEFAVPIIRATGELVAAFKPNLAFFEAEGEEGREALEKILESIRKQAPDIPVIGDGKRNDIGNTSKKYAEALFCLDKFGFDAATINPYLGRDALQPFLDWKNKLNFVLCLTSNPGASEFQERNVLVRAEELKVLVACGKSNVDLTEMWTRYSGMPDIFIIPFHHYVALRVNVVWNANHNCGLVTGATHADKIKALRQIAPELPFLIPGIGAQGGDLQAAVEAAADVNHSGFIINVSRSVIYASQGPDFADAARREVERLNTEIRKYLNGLS